MFLLGGDLLLYFISFLFLFAFSVFAVLSYHYRNIYRLNYFFGKKGAGKSLLMVSYMLKYMKKGYTIYSDIPALNIVGVRQISAKDLDKFVPTSNSVLFLDEVGISFDNRKFKSFSDGARDFFKFQRKYKVIVFMNSQSFDVDKKIRDLIDKFYLIQSFGNVICLCRPINRKVALVEASSQGESRVADNLKFAPFWEWKWLYMPKYFKYFDSFEAPARPILPFEEVTEGILIKKHDSEILNKIKKGTKIK